METQQRYRALVWRDTQSNIVGFVVGNTASGTQYMAESAGLDVTKAKWETVSVSLTGDDRQRVRFKMVKMH